MDVYATDTIRQSAFTGLIGVAQVDITPPLQIYSRNWGAATYDFAEGIHQPLTLTCVTFQSSKDDKPLVLISADLGWWKNSNDWLLRSSLLQSLKIGPEQLMFCCSHTHSGPVLSRDDTPDIGKELLDNYLLLLRDQSVHAVQNAMESAGPAILTWHYGNCSLATNRDLPDVKNNRFVVGFNPGKSADDTVLVGRITDEQNNITGTIVNYACHPTTLAWDNRLISPDYIGAMRGIVELSTNAPCLFLQGASGELSPAEQYVGDITIAEKNGRQLGYAVLSTLEGMLPPKTELVFSGIVESGAALGVWERKTYRPSVELSATLVEVPFSLRPLTSLEEIEKRYGSSEDRVMKERLFRKLAVRKAVGDGELVRVPLCIWQIGESFLVGQPNEAYSEFQELLRQELSPITVAVMNLVNGGIGYLAPEELYKEDIYQVWQSPFAAGSLELLTETAIAHARKIYSDNQSHAE